MAHAFLSGASQGITPGHDAWLSPQDLPRISWAQAAPVLPAVKTPSPKLYGKAQSQVFLTAAFVL